MTDIAIRVENLGKLYHIGKAQRRHDTLRDAVVDAFKRFNARTFKRSNVSTPDDTIWALKDVSFEVKRGEVLGIIGRNGAGKSTLLKILSRITEPTAGRAVVNGRVGSLLEVGTGFHPELTGRENIYLNGAILGMRKAEIERKFDEIVAFAEIEQFLDTPVKHYSSGMYVRLAFAVAAHLEPEILLVDEVLAVGDAQFQKKCLGKMGDVAHEGRTVLFVSHNMGAILSLCHAVIVIRNGKNSPPQAAQTAVEQYLEQLGQLSLDQLRTRERYQSERRPPIFVNLRILNEAGHENVVSSGSGVVFKIDLESFNDFREIECTIAITNCWAQRVVIFHTDYHANMKIKGSERAQLICCVPSLPLIPGTYFVDLVLAAEGRIVERVEQAGCFEVTFANILGTGKLPQSHQGSVVLPCIWSCQTGGSSAIVHNLADYE